MLVLTRKINECIRIENCTLQVVEISPFKLNLHCKAIFTLYYRRHLLCLHRTAYCEMAYLNYRKTSQASIGLHTPRHIEIMRGEKQANLLVIKHAPITCGMMSPLCFP